MLVTDLEHMEKIVAQRTDLEWEGWDVVRYNKSDKAMFSIDGVYKNGSWFKRKTFPITEIGWIIPNNIGGNNEFLER
jgi:hypothetical protein